VTKQYLTNNVSNPGYWLYFCSFAEVIRHLYIFCLLAFFSTGLIAQQKGTTTDGGNKMIDFSANRIVYKSSKHAQMLIGNVVFKHEGVVITCDSAYRFENNTVEAYDHVVIRRGDSLTITGDQLNYDGNIKQANVEGNVTCVEKDMVLTTPVLTYDVKNSVGSYFGGGTIVNKENTLTSRNGYYYSASKTLAFRHDVKLTNPDYTMYCDTLNYNTVSKTAFFVGPTTIVSKENKLYCENGWYDTQQEKSNLSTNAHVFTKTNELIADSIYYDRKAGYGKAFSCVQVIDTVNKTIIHGNLAEHFEKTNISIVTQKALLIKQFERDSMLITADTLFSEQRVSKIKGNKDSVFVKAYRNIKIYKPDLQGVSDSLTYTTYDSTLALYKNPVLWSDSTQLNAKEVYVHLSNNKVESFDLLGNAFIISQEDSLKFNQIKGKEVKGYFTNDTLRKIVVTGNAQVAYYIRNDKKKLIALNKTDCSSIHVNFGKGEIEKITFITKPVATLIPIKDVNPEQERFKGFSWNPQRKPNDKAAFLDFEK
jgi:lipopolysaccharide export system protein LptA